MALRIIGSDAFVALRAKVITNKNVIITEIGDLKHFPHGPVFDAETVAVEDCDKNFICHWIGPSSFPKAKRIILNNHPCDRAVFDRYGLHNTTQLLLPNEPSRYRRYHLWWADPDAKNIVLMDPVELEKDIANLYVLGEEDVQLK